MRQVRPLGLGAGRHRARRGGPIVGVIRGWQLVAGYAMAITFLDGGIRAYSFTFG